MTAERKPGVPKITTGGTGSFPFRVVWRELRPVGPIDPERDSEIAFCKTIKDAYT